MWCDDKKTSSNGNGCFSHSPCFFRKYRLFGKEDAGTELAKTIKTPAEALEIALRFENESIAFYTELYQRTQTDAKKLIQQIIDEEKEHAAEIMQFL